MPFSYNRSFLFEFNSSLSSSTLNSGSIINDISSRVIGSKLINANVEFSLSENGKNSLAMKDGVYYIIPSDPGSSNYYFGPFPNSERGLDWTFGIDFYSKKLGKVLLNGQEVSKTRQIAGQFNVKYDATDNNYIIYNNVSEQKYSEFIIFESGESDSQNSIHIWIRKLNEYSYYKYKTENYESGQWINLIININQPAVWNSGSLEESPKESYDIRFYVNCKYLSYFSYGEDASIYPKTNVEYLEINSPNYSFDFSINDKMFGHESQVVQLSSLVNEICCFNRRENGFEDRPYFSEMDVFDIFNYGLSYLFNFKNKVSNNSFISKSTVVSTVSINASEGSAEGQYLGLSDGRLIESKESVWQYLKLLNSNNSLQSVNVISLTSNYKVEVIDGSGTRFTGCIVELE
jgi:hypothetical protein